MPKPLLRNTQRNKEQNILSATKKNEQEQHNSQMSKMKNDRLLRQPRSKEYMEAVNKLDAGGHTHNEDKVREIISAITKEFPEVELTAILLGFVSKCYLGNPYEVHSLDITGRIIEHYKAGETMPGGLEKARTIAIMGRYEFIEVYVDCCRAVSSNGSVSVIPT